MQNLLGSLLRRFRNRNAASEPSRHTEPELARTIEQVVDGTDGTIRVIPRYRNKLRSSVSYALEFVDDLVERIPGPLDINRRTFVSDPRVHAFFVNVADMEMAFCRSSEVRDFLDDVEERQLSEVCALLCMQREEKQVFGVELSGDEVRRDVAQTAVNFLDHRVLAPAASVEETRLGLKQCLFQALTNNALQRIWELRGEHRQRHRAEAKSAALAGWGVGEVADTTRAAASSAARHHPAGPQEYLEVVNGVLAHPEQYVGLREVSLFIDKMGIAATPGSSRKADRVDLAEVSLGQDTKRVVVLARIPRESLLPSDCTLGLDWSKAQSLYATESTGNR